MKKKNDLFSARSLDKFDYEQSITFLRRSQTFDFNDLKKNVHNHFYFSKNMSMLFMTFLQNNQ